MSVHMLSIDPQHAIDILDLTLSSELAPKLNKVILTSVQHVLTTCIILFMYIMAERLWG